MYDKIEFENNRLEVVNFNLDPDPDGFIALQECSPEIVPRTVRRGKSEANGSWPTFTYYECLLWTLEGEVLAGSPQQCNIFWQNTLQKLMVLPEIQQTERTQGTFRIRLSGFTEDYTVPVSVEVAPLTPARANFVARRPFHMQFIAYRPYMFGATTGQYYWVT